jgi:hypothetical protein
MEVYAQLLMNPDGTVLGAAGSIRESASPARDEAASHPAPSAAATEEVATSR